MKRDEFLEEFNYHTIEKCCMHCKNRLGYHEEGLCICKLIEGEGIFRLVDIYGICDLFERAQVFKPQEVEEDD